MLSYGENPESLSHLGLVRYRVVTPAQTDRQTDGHNSHSYYALLAVPAGTAVARKNGTGVRVSSNSGMQCLCIIIQWVEHRKWKVVMLKTVFKWPPFTARDQGCSFPKLSACSTDLHKPCMFLCATLLNKDQSNLAKGGITARLYSPNRSIGQSVTVWL